MPDETPLTPPTSPTPGGKAKADEPLIFELEPAPPPPPRPPPRLGEKGLIDDMPEDADFTHDPEVERALKGEKLDAKKSSTDTVDEVAEPQPPLIKTGMGESKTIAMVGLGLAIAAVVAAAANTTTGAISGAFLALYFIIIHSLTGVGALAITAHLNDQPMGRVDLGAARMLATVSLFMFFMNLHIAQYHVIEPILGAVGYWLALTLLFRLPTGRAMTIAIFHFVFATVIWLGMITFAWATAPIAKT